MARYTETIFMEASYHTYNHWKKLFTVASPSKLWMCSCVSFYGGVQSDVFETDPFLDRTFLEMEPIFRLMDSQSRKLQDKKTTHQNYPCRGNH